MLWATNMEESINLNPFKMNSQIPEIDPQDLKFPLLDFDLVFVHYFHTISTFLYAGMIMCILQSYMLQLCNLLLDFSEG